MTEDGGMVSRGYLIVCLHCLIFLKGASAFPWGNHQARVYKTVTAHCSSVCSSAGFSCYTVRVGLRQLNKHYSPHYRRSSSQRCSPHFPPACTNEAKRRTRKIPRLAFQKVRVGFSKARLAFPKAKLALQKARFAFSIPRSDFRSGRVSFSTSYSPREKIPSTLAMSARERKTHIGG